MLRKIFLLVFLFATSHTLLAAEPATLSPEKMNKLMQKLRQEQKQRELAATEAKKKAEERREKGLLVPREIAEKSIRLERDEKGKPAAMYTSIIRMTKKNKRGRTLTVDLIGAVHIADKEYYKKLTQIFRSYSRVLFEMVIDKSNLKNGRIRGGGKTKDGGQSLLGWSQATIASYLELVHQLTEINYSTRNFVHADMSTDQLKEAMKNRGESIWSLMFRNAMNQQGGENAPSDAEVLAALFSPNRAKLLKGIFAAQLANVDSSINLFGDGDESAIIHDRNDAALKVLDAYLRRGYRKLALFYGAAHLPDFVLKLEKRGFKMQDEVRWIKAWDLKE